MFVSNPASTDPVISNGVEFTSTPSTYVAVTAPRQNDTTTLCQFPSRMFGVALVSMRLPLPRGVPVAFTRKFPLPCAKTPQPILLLLSQSLFEMNGGSEVHVVELIQNDTEKSPSAKFRSAGLP